MYINISILLHAILPFTFHLFNFTFSMYPKLASSLFEEIQYFMPLLSSHHYLPFGRNTFMDAKTVQLHFKK